MVDVDWESERSYAFVNPRLHEMDREALEEIKHDLKGHIFLTTSGTQSIKWVALSKKAFLASAQAVVNHIGETTKDVWINALPHYHVGGLSIYARAFIGKTFVHRYDYKWDPQAWVDFVQEKRGTLTSLVPTQLWDLVNLGIKPPATLRVVLLGGQTLPEGLYLKAKELGWPIMTTFGMTESCSQIATSHFDSPDLKLLPHVQTRIASDGRLSIKSEALLTGYLSPSFHDPKIEGWFETDDRVDIVGDILIPLGRITDVVKIKGELINLFQLETLLDSLKSKMGVSAETALVPMHDDRAGYAIHLFHTPYDVQSLVNSYNETVLPPARISMCQQIPALPRTPLGKISKKSLQR